MSVDSETRIALAEELEDIAMELASISQLSPNDDISKKQLLQSIQSETQRLIDIGELYAYEQLSPISTWVHKDILSLGGNLDLLQQKNAEGLFYVWLELLAAALRDRDDELLSELKNCLYDSAWSTPVVESDLQALLQSLSDANDDQQSAENEAINLEQQVPNETLKQAKEPPEITQALQKAPVKESSYILSWDDDIHPELLEAFFIETPDQVSEVAELIRNISAGGADKETHQAAARIAHTVKGSSAVVGIDAVARFAHKLEDILEYSVDNPLPKEVSELLIESADCLESMFDSLLTQSFPPQQYPQLLDKLTDWEEAFASGYLCESIPDSPPLEDNSENYELSWNKDVHPELLSAYLGETPGHVVDIAKLLRLISKGSVKKESYKKASRLAHTIRGTSSVVGITAIADFSNKLEEILDYAIEQPLPSSLLALLNESADLLESLYDSLLSEGTPPNEYPALYQKLSNWDKALLDKKEIESKQINKPLINTESLDKATPTSPDDFNSNTAKLSIDLPPLQEILPVITTPIAPATPAIHRANLNETSLRVPVSIIEKLLSFSSELITANTQMSDQIHRLLAERGTINERNERIRNMLDELEWSVNKQVTIGSKQIDHIKKHSQLDSLEMDSYNELHSIVGLLSESIDDDRETSLSLMRQLGALKGQTHKQKHLNKELNNTVLNMRMEPVKILVPRLERIIRETCRRTGKKAELEITGENITVDTDIIKGLIDPLLHLLRNAVDHGIEPAEIRKKQGKNSTGKITLTFTQLGDQVMLSLKDDGAGIDAEKVFNTAIARGLIKEDAKLSNNEKLRLILQSGFSTREEVSDVSGRGIGMDVVNTAVKNMSGSITIGSEKNQGSEVQIQLPLTLSAANILLVNISGNTIAIPNSMIQQVYYLSQDKVIFDDDQIFIDYQEKQIPLLALSTLLNWPSSNFITGKNRSVLIIEYNKSLYALYVDKVLKSQEVTLKTLKPWMTNVIGVNGVCLLTDGIVAPVINLYELLQESNKEALVAPINLSTSNVDNETQNKILVVDDSLSNRKALSLMLKALEYEVDTAIDGIDALKQIEKTKYKLIITDLEMPNMNGLEMVESLRAWPETRKLPVIMVTSRSTLKHRQLATQAGVNGYLTKPVDSETLKLTINQFFDQSKTTPLMKKAG